MMSAASVETTEKAIEVAQPIAIESQDTAIGPTEDGGFIYRNTDGSYITFTPDDLAGSSVKPMLFVDTVWSEAGAEVTLKISVNSGDWNSTSIHVDYDAANLEYVSSQFSMDVLLSANLGLKTITPYDGGLFFTTAGSGLAGTTTYAEITFKVTEDAQPGDFYPVTIDYIDGDIFTSSTFDDTTNKLATAYTFTNGIINGGVVIPMEATQTTTTSSSDSPDLMIIPSSLKMTPGDTNTLLVINAPDGASIQWTSDNTGVATVADGVVTAVGEGTATIYAACGGKLLECTVTVTGSGYSSGTVPPITPTETLGDIDADGAINALDASLVLTEYAAISTGKTSSLSASAKLRADIDSDGAINALDASYILSYYSYTATGGKESIFEFLK